MRRQVARAAALVGHFPALADAERERRVVVEEERRDVVVVDEEEDVGLLLPRAMRATGSKASKIGAQTGSLRLSRSKAKPMVGVCDAATPPMIVAILDSSSSTSAPSVDVAQAGLRQRLAHRVHVQAEHAGGELGALGDLSLRALLRRVGDRRGERGRDDDDAVVVGDDRRRPG